MDKCSMNKTLINKALRSPQRKRFLLIYPYLNRILGSLRRKKFGSASSFDWDDMVAKTYYDIFILCASRKWLKYSPQQVERFLYVTSSNCLLGELIRIQKKNIPIDEEVIPDGIDRISVFDVIEEKGKGIEKQLLRMYKRLLGKRAIDEEYKIIIKRYARILAEEDMAKRFNECSNDSRGISKKRKAKRKK